LKAAFVEFLAESGSAGHDNIAAVQIEIDTPDQPSLSRVAVIKWRNAMERVKSYASPDGSRKLEIFRKPSGLFQFEEFEVELIIDPDPDFSGKGTIYWSCSYLSGLHDSLDAADTEAKEVLTWLRDGKYVEA
jgi:hypothetical protein